ncbi:MAG: cytochrome P450 [Gammaproteobacteria bacterium]|nr:cytochrome P450 [Gammaproteobacteria bacterium]
MSDAAVRLKLPPGPAERYTIDAEPQSLPVLERLTAEYGDIVCIHSKDRPHPSLFLNDPGHIRQVLIGNHDNYVKGVGFERVKMLLGNGIITSDGDFWRRQRTMIQPGFNRSSVAQLSSNVYACNLELKARWQDYADAGATIDVTSAMSHYGLEVILRSIFSEDLPKLVAESNPFAFLAEDPTRDIRTVLKVRELGRVILACIAARRASDSRPHDFLSLMIDARDRKTGASMTDAEILDELRTLIIAGHETSAGTLNWCWYLLHRHPAVMTELLREIRQRLPGGRLRYDDVMALQYMPRVLKETLRLYPPVWLFSRRAVGADRLGGYDVPVGAHIFISPYLFHRNRRYWPDPERFDPGRFAAPDADEKEKLHFIPFSAGSRRCAGEYFAFVEMQVHLAMMAPRFELASIDAEPMGIDPAINLRSRSGIVMRIGHRRPEQASA